MTNRREFLQRLTMAAAAATVVPFQGVRTLDSDNVFVAFTPGPLHAVDDNWWAWRQRIYEIHRSDHEVRTFTLGGEDGGYRKARVEVVDCWTGKHEVWTWDQPWSRDSHYRSNLHMDLGSCNDCGALTKTPHAQHCKHSTALAHKLGPNLDGFKVESDLITAPTKDYRGPWKT